MLASKFNSCRQRTRTDTLYFSYNISKLTQVYSHHLGEKPLIERVFVKAG